jgi:hypothetical protein
MQTLQLINVYNSCLISIFFTKDSLIISRLNELIKNDCKQLVVRNFNLHHLHWEDRRYFFCHAMIDVLLNIIINVQLKLLLESDTITWKTYNQLMTINLVFDSNRIQFMIYKCKVRIDLHQSSNHLSIVTKLCLHTFFIQSLTCWLWKKMNMKSLSIHLRIYLTADCSLNDKAAINDRVIKITYILQEVIKKSTFWAKSLNHVKDFWNQRCFKIIMKSRYL